MHIYSYTEHDIEDLATDAGMKMIAWLWKEGYLGDEMFDELTDARPVFLFREVSWYFRLWKKLWPTDKANSCRLMIARLPSFRKELESMEK